MAYLNEAHARLLAGLAKAAPATISIWPTPDEFEEQAKQIKEWNSLWVEFLHSVAIDGKQNATGNTINAEVTGYVTDAMNEFAGQFTETADRLREDKTEQRLERAGAR